MKTLHDIRQYCYEEIERATESLINNLEENTPFDNGRYQGYIRAYQEISDEIRHALKHHECKFIEDRCIFCGETAEAV